MKQLCLVSAVMCMNLSEGAFMRTNLGRVD